MGSKSEDQLPFPRADPIVPAFVRLHTRLFFASTILLVGSAPSVLDLALAGPDQDSPGVDLLPHATSVQSIQSFNNNTDVFKFVLLDGTLESSRPYRVCSRSQISFADGFHPYPRFGEEEVPHGFDARFNLHW
ncbi:hypothetical protein U9M48_041144 [Paspalum notatum var. saurae]|uniref:Uncharacterized protein n=1 Tax=Paspalum notatum var. saurae TaxID=547442 RepID=A0AAQ3USI9_PASNO